MLSTGAGVTTLRELERSWRWSFLMLAGKEVSDLLNVAFDLNSTLTHTLTVTTIRREYRISREAEEMFIPIQYMKFQLHSNLYKPFPPSKVKSKVASQSVPHLFSPSSPLYQLQTSLVTMEDKKQT